MTYGMTNAIERKAERCQGRTANVAGWLSLAAAPTFAGMALLTGVPADAMPDMLCSAAHHASPLSGMGLMYALMAIFHAAPWLKLASRRQDDARRP